MKYIFEIPQSTAELTRVQFQTRRIPEGSNKQLIEHYLAASLLGVIPGLIIRKETKRELGIGDHEDLVEFIQKTLLEQGAMFKAGPTKSKTKPQGIGDYHTDGVEAKEKVLNFNVHTTSRGEGDVLLGLPGNAAKELIDAEARVRPGLGTLAVRSEWERPLHDLALSGETFAELMDPEGVFVGRVSEEDSIVMALESQRGPMFHRYDTDTEDREALITELHRPA